MALAISELGFDLASNPFLDAVCQRRGLIERRLPVASAHERHRLQQLRDALCYRYAYALPTPALLEKVAAYAPLVEMGCGRGYWANLLQAGGVDVVAYDERAALRNEAIKNNLYLSPCNTTAYTDIVAGGPRALAQHADRTLFLCWPPINNMALDCLKWFAGDTLIYLGTGIDGMDAPNSFFVKLNKHWRVLETIEINESLWNNPEMMMIYGRK